MNIMLNMLNTHCCKSVFPKLFVIAYHMWVRHFYHVLESGAGRVNPRGMRVPAFAGRVRELAEPCVRVRSGLHLVGVRGGRRTRNSLCGLLTVTEFDSMHVKVTWAKKLMLHKEFAVVQRCRAAIPAPAPEWPMDESRCMSFEWFSDTQGQVPVWVVNSAGAGACWEGVWGGSRLEVWGCGAGAGKISRILFPMLPVRFPYFK